MSEMALAHTVSDKVEAAYRRGDMRENTLEDVEALINEMVLPESSIDPDKNSDHSRQVRLPPILRGIH
jgi:hypothetical protein